MNKFETPVIELIKFDAMDVIATSGGGVNEDGDVVTPDDEF